MDSGGAQCVAAGTHRGGRCTRHCQCVLHTHHPTLQHGNTDWVVHSGEAVEGASRAIQGERKCSCLLSSDVTNVQQLHFCGQTVYARCTHCIISVCLPSPITDTALVAGHKPIIELNNVVNFSCFILGGRDDSTRITFF